MEDRACRRSCASSTPREGERGEGEEGEEDMKRRTLGKATTP